MNRIAVLWDLDGTLIDSAGDIAAAIDATLARRGLRPLGLPVVRGFIGDGARKLVDRCVTAAGGTPDEAVLADFLAQYEANLVVHTVVHPPGVEALLARVAAPQAIVTNKPERLARGVLEALDLARYFPVVIGGDTLPVRKPDPAPLHEALRLLGADRGVMVGDGPADVGGARNAGMPCIGVGWGIAAPEGADVRVDTLYGLARALIAAGVRLE